MAAPEKQKMNYHLKQRKMKRSIFLASLIAGCVWFSDSAAQVVVTRRPVIYGPHKVAVVKPAPVVVPARSVVVVPRPVVARHGSLQLRQYRRAEE